MILEKEFQKIERLFLDFDDEKKIAYVCRNYSQPSDIIEFDGFTKTPLLRSEYLEWISDLFAYIPKKYKLDITVSFDDMEGHDPEELKEISYKNLLLQILILSRKVSDQNSLALILCAIGFVFILFHIFLSQRWASEGSLQEIVLFITDILATVPFWAAADIFFVANSEQREAVKSFRKRFNPVQYKQKS